jgi:hypothetical protein
MTLDDNPRCVGGGMQDLFAADAPAPLDASAAPTDEATRRVATAARALAAADARLARAEALCEAVRKRRNDLATRVLPALMDSVGQDRCGLPDMNCDVVVEPFYAAAIKADWPPERREAAFQHLEELGGGDVVRAELSVQFRKEDLPAARRLLQAVDTWVNKARVDAVTSLDLSVHWKTLTSWLTAHLESERARDPHLPEPNTPRLDLDLLGATVGRKAKVVRRKDKPAVRGRRRK